MTTFKNTPDLPFEELELHFFGGERAPLSTPSRCGTYTTQASFTPWDGNAPVEHVLVVPDHLGPNGAPCPGASLPFDPSLTAGTTSIQAGGFSPFTMTMTREDGQQNLQAISLTHAPRPLGPARGSEAVRRSRRPTLGRAARKARSAKRSCRSVSAATRSACKGGKVYITGPYKGAPFGLSIVNPAKAGPFDLGQRDCVRGEDRSQPDHRGADDHERQRRARTRSRRSSTGYRCRSST